MNKSAVIVSSDRAHAGTYEDKAGPAAGAWLENAGYAVASVTVVPDEPNQLRETIHRLFDLKTELIVISGGTGLGPRDVTPQVLDDVADYMVPGFGEMMRQGSLKYSLNAYLSRCGGWVKGRTLILAVPGNPKAVTEQLDLLKDLLPHALKSLRGECEHRRKVTPGAAEESL
jgi:molybdenum cofactor synthesis domain-containing protein